MAAEYLYNEEYQKTLKLDFTKKVMAMLDKKGIIYEFKPWHEGSIYVMLTQAEIGFYISHNRQADSEMEPHIEFDDTFQFARVYDVDKIEEMLVKGPKNV